MWQTHCIRNDDDNNQEEETFSCDFSFGARGPNKKNAKTNGPTYLQLLNNVTIMMKIHVNLRGRLNVTTISQVILLSLCLHSIFCQHNSTKES